MRNRDALADAGASQPLPLVHLFLELFTILNQMRLGHALNNLGDGFIFIMDLNIQKDRIFADVFQ